MCTHTHKKPHPLITIPRKYTRHFMADYWMKRSSLWSLEAVQSDPGCMLSEAFICLFPLTFLSFFKILHNINHFSFFFFVFGIHYSGLFFSSGFHQSVCHITMNRMATAKPLCFICTYLQFFLLPQECRVEIFRNIFSLCCRWWRF